MPRAPSKEEAKELLEQAFARTDLMLPGSPPFHLRAQVTVFKRKNKTTQGTFDLAWASPERWRTEYTWLEAKTVRIVDGDHIWVLDDDAHRLDQDRLAPLLSFPSTLHLNQSEHLTRVQRKNLNGIIADCIELHRDLGPVTSTSPRLVFLIGNPNQLDRRICLDAAKHLPVSAESGSFRWGLADYSSFGTKQFPRLLNQFREGKPFVTIEVKGLESLDPTKDDAFAPPAGATSKPWCRDEVSPFPVSLGGADRSYIAINGFVPLPPGFERYALVVFEVDPQGHVTAVKAFDSEGCSSLKDSDARELLKTVFKPATCHGQPIESEFEFHLNR
jgi:hypothetical protein